MYPIASGETPAGAATHRVPLEYATITAALGVSAPGDTILLAPGTHVEPSGISLPSGVSLIGDGSRNEVRVDLGHFYLQALDPDSTATHVAHVEFRQVGEETVFFGFSANPYVRIRWNRFLQKGRTVMDGGFTFEHNEILHQDPFQGGGFSISPALGGDPVGDVVFRYNVTRLADGGLFFGGSQSVPNADISHNTIVFPYWGGGGLVTYTEFVPRNTNLTLSSNIFWGQGFSCRVEGSGTFTMVYNCFWPFAPADPPCDPWFGPTNIEEDPLLCDWSLDVDDYRLGPGSPCIGTGENGTNMGALGIGCSAVSVGTPEAGRWTTLRVVPNPLSGSSVIALDLARSREVALRVFDVTGRVRGWMDLGVLEAGSHQVAWETARGAGELPPGVYYLRLEHRGRAEGAPATTRIVVTR